MAEIDKQHNEICLKSVKDILGMSFYIPKYQRGYRWGKQQVEDLLNDLNEFDADGGNFYCLQPLVVKNRNNENEQEILTNIREKADSLMEVKKMLQENWEVIDGQQRLTTLFIILKALNSSETYDLEYETREDSKNFLKKLELNKDELTENKNIDFFHIYRAFRTVKEWFYNKNIDEKESFKNKLIQNVKFIWYESKEENPIEVFTRLNIGKISLTNAELIKAMILNRNNFDKNNLTIRQETIALEWDNIEYTLQNDEFWYFLNNIGTEKVTRIDFIFDLIEKEDYLKVKINHFDGDEDKYNKAIGSDDYKTFRYFYEYFKNTNKKKDFKKENLLKEAWDKVKEIFRTFQEWFDDVEFYHYLGYLISIGKENILEIYENWKSSNNKEDFKLKYIEDRIKKSLKNCKDLDKQYEIKGSPKTQCKPLLLLHNIQTIINQNRNNIKGYEQQLFQKFPFHIFKKEKWDVEHIDSNTENSLSKPEHQKEWLLYSLLDPLMEESKLKGEIIECYQNIENRDNKDKDTEVKEIPQNGFEVLRGKIEKFEESNSEKSNRLSDDEKNKIWNFVLLDSSTNRGYGNSIFPVKRRCIIGKDQGKKYKPEIIKQDFISGEEEGDSAFIPPCTRYAFMKYYNPNSASIRVWDKNDAKEYKKDLFETIKVFGVESEELNIH